MTPDKLNSCNFYHLSDKLEIVVDKKDHFNMEEGDDFNLEDIKTILAFKESRNLSKDQQDIANIKKYLNKKFPNKQVNSLIPRHCNIIKL